MTTKLFIGAIIFCSTMLQAKHMVQLCSDKKSVESVFNRAKNEHKLVVIDFFAEWCGPCKMLAPTLERLAGELKDKCIFAKVDVDQCKSLSQEYQIRAMPTIVIIRDGKEIDRIVGSKSYSVLKKELERYF